MPMPSDGGAMEIARWEAARSAARDGRLDDIPADIYIRHYRTLKDIRKDHMPELPALNTLKNFWIYGESGSGKTAVADFLIPGAYPKNCD